MTTSTRAPQPGDTAQCATCGATIHYDFPLAASALSPAVPSRWTHLRTRDPATLRPITYDHWAVELHGTRLTGAVMTNHPIPAQPPTTIHRTDTQRVADYGRLLARIAATLATPDPFTAPERVSYAQAILHRAGIHPGQVDADGQPVPLVHDPGCKECEQEATT